MFDIVSYDIVQEFFAVNNIDEDINGFRAGPSQGSRFGKNETSGTTFRIKKKGHSLTCSEYLEAEGTPGYRTSMASSSGMGYETVKVNTLMTASEFVTVHATYKVCSTQVP